MRAMRKVGRAAGVAAAILALGAGGVHAHGAGREGVGGEVDSQRLALADRIYGLIGDQSVRSVSRALKTMLASSFGAQAGAGQDPARTQALQAALSDSLDDMTPKIMHATARLMAQDFSAEELQAMLAFYQSPTGQAMLRKMPEITQQSVQLSLSFVPGFIHKFESDYCARVTCTAQETQAFAQLNARIAQTPAPAAR